MVERMIGATRLVLKQGDITKEEVDAIVNAANPSLMGGGGVDGAIHRAGGPTILEDCKRIIARINKLHTGQAVITTGGSLPAKHVIHTVGPIWHGGLNKEPEFLRSCYQESLKIAVANGCRTIAFPSISTGVYGYPVSLAALVALKAVIDFLAQNPPLKEIRLVLFDQDTFLNYSRALEEVLPLND